MDRCSVISSSTSWARRRISCTPECLMEPTICSKLGRMTCSARFSLISTSKPFRISTIGPCVYSPGRAPSPTPRNRGHGISYAGALPPCPGSRCRISPWPLRCSFRLDVHQLRRPLLVVRYQTLEDGFVTLGLALVVLSPLSPKLPFAFGVVAPETLLPKVLARFMPLFGCAPVVAPLYEAVEFVLDPLAPAYIHLTLLLSFHCPRTRGQARRPLVLSGYCYRPRPRPYIGIGTQGRKA